MRRIFTLIIGLVFLVNSGKAQNFQIDTLQYRGDINKYINVVIMGDGYTAAEQNTFISDAKSLYNYIFTQAPWSNYASYFNAFAIRVVSQESGAIHPNTAADCSSAAVPVSNPNTYFGCSFDSYNIHRLVMPTKTFNVANVLSTHFPAYDQVLIIANSTYYGGSGGSYATSTKEKSSPEIIAHELAHSFANLADEYYAGDQYAGERANMTRETNPALVKWKNWMGINQTGIFQHCCGGNSAQWYKPHQNCKMQYLGTPFCSVCAETIIEKIHQLVNPVVSYQPVSSAVNSPDRFIRFRLTELIKPLPNTLEITWELDGAKLQAAADSLVIDQNSLSQGEHTLNVSVVDTSKMVRVDNHAKVHSSVVSWTIRKTATSVNLLSSDNRISWSVYPNPASDWLNIAVETDKNTELSLRIYTSDGRLYKEIIRKTAVEGKYAKSFSIANLPVGNYILKLGFGDVVQTHRLVKIL
jgi:hypothetical protein